MPNWKTYESSIRLLSAIIAAHPELKLNYDGKPIDLFFLRPYTTSRSVSSDLTFCSNLCPALEEGGKKQGVIGVG
jgi:hypothetical protein